MKNPLRGLRFSLLDFHAARATAGTKIAMLGIALVPLIYGALYLMAFYDPYGNLDAIPVAVVNEDVAAYTADGQKVEAGKDLVEELKESDSLDYHFVDAAEAQAGLEDGTYYNKIVIPSDFSADIASADGDDPQKAHLKLVTNDANNYLSSILGASVMRVVTAKTNAAVGENYYVQVFDRIEDTGAELTVAADGAAELASGLGDAHDGAQKITDNLKTAAAGSTELGEGLKSAHDGSATITSKLGEAHDGAQTLASGIADAASGSAAITDGLGSAAEGARTLDSGLAQISEGLATGKTGSAELAAGLHQLQTQGSSQLATGTAQLKAALDAKQGDFAALAQGTSQVAAGVDQVAALMSPQTVGTIGTLKSQVDGYAQTVDGLSTKVGALTNAQSGPFARISALKGSVDREYAAINDEFATLKAPLEQSSAALDTLKNVAAGAYGQASAASGDATAAAQLLKGLISGAEVDKNGNVTVSLEALSNAASKAQSAATEADTAAAIVGNAGQTSAGGTSSVYGGLNAMATGLAGVSGAKASIDGHKANINEYMASINTIYDGVQQQLPEVLGTSSELVRNSQKTIQSAQALLAQAAQGASQVGVLQAGAHQVATGANELVRSLSGNGSDGGTLYAAVATLASGSAALDSKVAEAAAGADALRDGTAQLADGSLAAATGAAALKRGLGELYAGSETLTSGLSTAKSGSLALALGLGQLQSGSATLTSGLASAQAGDAKLTDGLGQLRDGSATLTEGLVSARDGAGELADGLAEGVSKVEESTEGADARASMMSEPVELEQEAYTEVPNYGTGFAPYFIALGLWVGALVMTFLLKPLNNRLISSGATPAVAALAGLVPWLIVGAVQGLLLGATIQFACGIDVLHPAAYYALVVLSSAVFCAMVQAITALFGFPGKFVAVILLMLQLTTAAGTFPIETEFSIFQALSPYLPMTYIVHALRLAMRGVDLALVGHDVSMLAAFGLVSFMVTCLVAHRKRMVTMMDLHPLVDL